MGKQMRRSAAALLTLFMLFFSYAAVGDTFSFAQEGSVRMLCLNIGKADCILISVDAKTYLIDTGYEYNWGALQTALTQCGVSRLNGVFLTHCHEDHTGGLMMLAMSGFSVEAWYAASVFYDCNPKKHPVMLAAESCGNTVIWLNAGDTVGVSPDSRFTVLGPLSANTENENNNSLVLRLDTAQGSILLAGDMKEEEESELLSLGLVSSCDILKVGHHGDNNASSEAFLDAASPRAAVISTSTAQEADTPASGTLRRLAACGAVTAVTQDYDAGVLLTLRNQNVTIENVSWDIAPAAKTLSMSIMLPDDLISINNSGSSDQSLNGFALYSTLGSECFFFSEGITVPAGGTLTVGTLNTSAEVDITLDDKRVWHKSKLDEAVLYDEAGRETARTDNGMPR